MVLLLLTGRQIRVPHVGLHLLWRSAWRLGRVETRAEDLIEGSRGSLTGQYHAEEIAGI
jgi:hypothetical protein